MRSCLKLVEGTGLSTRGIRSIRLKTTIRVPATDTHYSGENVVGANAGFSGKEHGAHAGSSPALLTSEIMAHGCV